jgi:DNA polymerase III epsilon subunit-like protein
VQYVEKGRFEAKIFPTKEVPEEVAKLNGYDPEVWAREAVSLDEAMLKYFKFLMWSNFGGQNPAFDKGFLLKAAEKCQLPWP